ncbi:MAG: hypothetical protein RJB39_221 [Candidatus Parcubacteria bacterium]|jgi:hypothetical protein
MKLANIGHCTPKKNPMSAATVNKHPPPTLSPGPVLFTAGGEDYYVVEVETEGDLEISAADVKKLFGSGKKHSAATQVTELLSRPEIRKLRGHLTVFEVDGEFDTHFFTAVNCKDGHQTPCRLSTTTNTYFQVLCAQPTNKK